MSSLFLQPEMMYAEIEARRARLSRDWEQHPRRTRQTHRLNLAFHLPVRVRRHA